MKIFLLIILIPAFIYSLYCLWQIVYDWNKLLKLEKILVVTVFPLFLLFYIMIFCSLI